MKRKDDLRRLGSQAIESIQNNSGQEPRQRDPGFPRDLDMGTKSYTGLSWTGQISSFRIVQGKDLCHR